jgi:uncharacterized protein (TIGR02145 family)
MKSIIKNSANLVIMLVMILTSCSDISDDAAADTYGYCISTGDKSCTSGSFTTSSCNGQVSNTCPYGSSSSTQSSSSAECNGEGYNPQEQSCCGSVIYGLENQRCGESYVVETKCGTGWYRIVSQRCNADNIVEAMCGTIWYNTVNQNCYGGSIIEEKCGDSFYNPSDYECCGSTTFYLASQDKRCGEGNVVETKCGQSIWYDASDPNLRCDYYYGINNETQYEVQTRCGTDSDWYNSEKQFCLDSKIYYKCNGNTYNQNQYCSNGTVRTYGSVFDDDGNAYKTVVIGNQTWMAENLNYETENGSECYNDDSENCEKYGRIYNWATAMNLGAVCNSISCQDEIDDKHQGICPVDWHIPTKAEMDELIASVGGSDVAGKHLKAVEGWDRCGPLGYKANSCEDTYGFAAVSGSSSNYNGYYSGRWWSSSENDNFGYGVANVLYMYYGSDAAIIEYYSKSGLNSIRCVMDE